MPVLAAEVLRAGSASSPGSARSRARTRCVGPARRRVPAARPGRRRRTAPPRRPRRAGRPRRRCAPATRVAAQPAEPVGAGAEPDSARASTTRRSTTTPAVTAAAAAPAPAAASPSQRLLAHVPHQSLRRDVPADEPPADPGDDLIGDRAAGLGPVLGGRRAVAHRCRTARPGRRRAASAPARGRRRTGPCTPAPRPGAAAGRRGRRRVEDACRGTPSPYPTGTRPTVVSRSRGPGVPVGHARAGRRSA